MNARTQNTSATCLVANPPKPCGPGNRSTAPGLVEVVNAHPKTHHGIMQVLVRAVAKVQKIRTRSARRPAMRKMRDSRRALCFLQRQESIDRRTIYFINVAQCDTSDCGMAKRLRKGSFRTLCGWIDVFPSSHFSNVDC